ncbi:MAG: 1-deoxy-D-xylulose-5-phosphate synthase [Planctomycetales bacterium]|nr:1-deoxy-D-xylulose-5-phosphate synthase [Planctomycetales bacterium]
MHRLLSKIESAETLRGMSVAELNELAGEIREVLCNLLSTRSAHFASNLGVVELTLALHSVFDFRRDRLIWDTGHQIYPHKLVTGRYHEFSTIRTRGGLMGYPNPHESEYDLFMTGHAGCSVSTVLGLRSGDDLMGESDRHSVAVIGDGAFPSGIVFEAMNNAGGLKKKLLVILNDNKMSICPRVGGMASYMDRLRTNPMYTGLKHEVVRALNMVPVFGDPAERFLAQLKEGIKAGLHGGMMFEELGFRYIGPIDGHNVGLMRKYLEMVKSQNEPVLLHVVTEKGHGFQPAESDPVYFHTPPCFVNQNGQAVPKQSSGGGKAYTNYASSAIQHAMRRDERVTVLTAAMCQGNKLEPVREEFPDRFFDVGICESHAVAFAAGQAKAGMRPIVDIYSTFLQRSFDQVFQEVALQNLPVTFMMDRAGLTGPDGPTHHGVFDIGYMRLFPNMAVMAPGDAVDLREMVDFAIELGSPCSIRYPKCNAVEIEGERQPVELGKSEVFHWGHDGMIVACGTLLRECLQAAQTLREEGLDVGVVNVRFIKPLDAEVMRRVLAESQFVVTVEEGQLMTGFGSALLEFANDEGLSATHVRRLGLPDRFVEHGERGELLAELKLDAAGIVRTCRELADGEVTVGSHSTAAAK